MEQGFEPMWYGLRVLSHNHSAVVLHIHMTQQSPGKLLKFVDPRDFPGGLVVKTSPSNAGDAGSTPGRGVEIHMPHGQKAKT